jgi:hypothetical protein
MTSLAGATAADASDANPMATSADQRALVAMSAQNIVMTALNPAPPAPTSPVIGTKISLATPDLTAIRKAGKESARNLGPQARKAEFNVERDKVVDRFSQAVGFNGITDTVAVTPKLKGISDPTKVTKCELDKSLRNVFDRQWEETPTERMTP